MSRWMKKSSGILSGSGILTKDNAHYFGFVLITGGSNRQFTAYNGQSAVDGKEIENMLCDGNKPSDGHSHADPVLCSNGIYYSIATGATAIIYYWDEL